MLSIVTDLPFAVSFVFLVIHGHLLPIFMIRVERMPWLHLHMKRSLSSHVGKQTRPFLPMAVCPLMLSNAMSWKCPERNWCELCSSESQQVWQERRMENTLFRARCSQVLSTQVVGVVGQRGVRSGEHCASTADGHPTVGVILIFINSG